MRLFSIILLSLIAEQGFASFNWIKYFEKSNDLSEVYDEYQATQPRWQVDSNYQSSLKLFTPKKSNDIGGKVCGDSFFPAHPLATTKTYHYARYKEYDLKQLPADSYYCRVPSRGKRKYCLSAGTLLFIVMSDTFIDSCGNKFRGFWAVTYNSDDENMGTLLAKGRTIEAIPNSPFKNDYRPSNTYEVSRSDFIHLAPLFTGDQAKINKGIMTAKKNHKLIMSNNIFSKRP